SMKRKNMMLPMLGGAATVRAESVNEEERTFEIVWTAGARRRVQSWWSDDYDEELEVSTKAIRLERMQAGNVPFLKDHNYRSIDNVIGNIVPGSARIENGQGLAT